MSDPFATTRAGQSLLNAELINGLSAKDAELHALKMGQIHSGGSGSTSDLKKKVQALEAERNRIANSLRIANGAAQDSVDALRAAEEALVKANEKLEKRGAAIIERDSLLKEWLLQSEACRRLAKSYGRAQGRTEDEIQSDFDQQVLNVVEEDPSYAETSLNKKVIARNSKSKSKLS